MVLITSYGNWILPVFMSEFWLLKHSKVTSQWVTIFVFVSSLILLKNHLLDHLLFQDVCSSIRLVSMVWFVCADLVLAITLSTYLNNRSDEVVWSILLNNSLIFAWTLSKLSKLIRRWSIDWTKESSVTFTWNKLYLWFCTAN